MGSVIEFSVVIGALVIFSGLKSESRNIELSCLAGPGMRNESFFG